MSCILRLTPTVKPHVLLLSTGYMCWRRPELQGVGASVSLRVRSSLMSLRNSLGRLAQRSRCRAKLARSWSLKVFGLFCTEMRHNEKKKIHLGDKIPIYDPLSLAVSYTHCTSFMIQLVDHPWLISVHLQWRHSPPGSRRAAIGCDPSAEPVAVQHTGTKQNDDQPPDSADSNYAV